MKTIVMKFMQSSNNWTYQFSKITFNLSKTLYISGVVIKKKNNLKCGTNLTRT